MTYTCKRTGETFANEAMAKALVSNCDGIPPAIATLAPIAIPVSASSPGGLDTRARDASGNLVTNQEGSQFWMDAGYKEAEPTLAVKAVFSTADYSRDWIGEYSRTLTGDISAAVQGIQKYPVTESTAELWKAVPALKPAGDVVFNTPSGSAGAVSQVAAGKTDTVGTSGIGTTLKSYGLYIVGGIVLVIVALVVIGRKL